MPLLASSSASHPGQRAFAGVEHGESSLGGEASAGAQKPGSGCSSAPPGQRAWAGQRSHVAFSPHAQPVGGGALALAQTVPLSGDREKPAAAHAQALKSFGSRPKVVANSKSVVLGGGAQGSASSSVDPGGQAKPGLHDWHTLMLFARGTEE